LTIITVGSTGDVQPYVALGTGLQRAGFTVRVATHAEFEELIVGQGLSFAPISGHPRAEVESEEGQAWLDTGGNGLAFVRRMAGIMRPMMAQAFRDAWSACDDADAVLYSLLGWFGAQQVIEKKRLPGIAAYLQPVTPTRAFLPIGAYPAISLGPWCNLLLHRLGERIYWRVFRDSVNEARRAALGLGPMPARAPFDELRSTGLPVIYGYSPALLARPDDWPGSVHVTGYWFLERQPEWKPPADLLEFLEAGPPPVYVGFGSMHRRDATGISALVADALRATGQRAVIATGWGGMSSAGLTDDVYPTEFVPHDWLFPRMAAVVHHAGAGTTGAGVRAGVPTVSVPFFADQPFWALCVHRAGAGPKPIPVKRLTAARLAHAIDAAIGEERITAGAAELGERVRAEDGVARAVEIISRYLTG